MKTPIFTDWNGALPVLSLRIILLARALTEFHIPPQYGSGRPSSCPGRSTQGSNLQYLFNRWLGGGDQSRSGNYRKSIVRATNRTTVLRSSSPEPSHYTELSRFACLNCERPKAAVLSGHWPKAHAGLSTVMFGVKILQHRCCETAFRTSC